MRLLFPLEAFYPSQIGGPCNTLYWHTCRLTQTEIDVDIVTTTLGISENKVRENIEYKADCGIVYYGTHTKLNINTIRKALKKIADTDIIHLNSLFSFISISCFFYSRLFHNSKPVIWSVRGELSPSALGFSTWKKKPLLKLYKMSNKKVQFHSTSDKETIDIKTVFEKANVIQIPNLVKPHQRIMTSTKKQFLYVGRIHPIKSIHKLIEAFGLSELFSNSDYELLLLGKPEDRYKYYYDELVAMVEKFGLNDKIKFLGHVEGEEKENKYAESYALILPSETENFGNVVLESLNQGTPVIASLGTPWEILEEHKCGFHVSNEPQNLAKAIDEMISMPAEQYEMMQKNAITLIENEFNIETQIHRWIKNYKEVYVQK